MSQHITLRLILFLSLLFIFYISGCTIQQLVKVQPKAIKGTLDLSEWDLKKDGPVNCVGEWEFYWNQFLESADFDGVEKPQCTGHIKVPAHWNDFTLPGGKKAGEYGYATYRLKIITLELDGLNALKIPHLPTAYRLYVNGKAVSSNGKVGKKKKEAIPQLLPQIVDIREDSGTAIDVIVHISNFHGIFGGMANSIVFGKEKSLLNRYFREFISNGIIVGAIFIICLYHLTLFGQRRKDKASLFFGFFCILIVLRIFCTTRYIWMLFSTYNMTLFNSIMKLEYFTAYLTAPVFLMFLKNVFNKELETIILRFFQATGIIFTVIAIISPADFFMPATFIPSQIMIVLGIIYAVFSACLAIYRKRTGALLVLSGIIFLSFTVVNDILVHNHILQTFLAVHYGLVGFIFFQSLIISLRFSRTYKNVEKKVKELSGLHNIGTVITSIFDMDNLLNNVLKNVVDNFGYSRAMLLLYDEEKNVLHNGRCIGGPEEISRFVENLEIPVQEDSGVFSRVVLKNHSILVKDVKNTNMNVEMNIADSLKASSYLIIPIKTQEKVLGVLAVDNYYNKNILTKEDENLLNTMAVQVGISIENVKLMKERENYQEQLEEQVMERTATLKIVNDNLEQEIKERSLAEEEARRAKETAEKANKTKSEFLANMSHEIRTPMNAIMGYNSLLTNTELNPKQQEYVNKISISTRNLLGIIDDILDFSKIEAGKLVIESTNFDLKGVIETLLNVTTIKAQDKGLQLICTIQNDVPVFLTGDQLRLGQILLNLVNNAIKFTEKGEIRIITELIDREEEMVVLKFSVKDTGIGLTKEQKNKLFRAFSQADTSTTRKYGGTGLGLIICKKLVEMMGGSIGFTSEYGKGSTFYFTVTLKVQRNIIKKQTSGDQRPGDFDAIRGSSILLVEDNEINRLLAIEILEKEGFWVTPAGNGKDALEKLSMKKYDVVLMDLQMPVMDGYMTTKEIRNNKILKKLPVIALTADAMRGVCDRVFEAGMDDYMSKPFELIKLRKILLKWIKPGKRKVNPRYNNDLKSNVKNRK